VTSYGDAGVDLEAAEAIVAGIRTDVTRTWHDGVVGDFGGFAAGIRLPGGFADPVLMMSTDGVGTKAEVARMADRLEGIGWDLVAMCVDDLAAAGACPIAMTDYLAVGRIDVERVARIVASVADACAAAGVALLGGETAEHPGVLAGDAFDLAGAALGVVERGREVDGSAIRPGDAVVGLASPNLRSNGFSLVRATVLSRLGLDDELPNTGRTVVDVVLEPSVLYSPTVQDLLTRCTVHGMAHITGGGLPGNLPRILPAGCDAVIDTAAWAPPAVFGAVAQLGGTPHDEMFRTFNMGVGFVVVVDPSDVATVTSAAGDRGHDAFVIGEVTAGTGRAILSP
jgi:phosphoribosylformylglycinamidine cyclo-ligase